MSDARPEPGDPGGPRAAALHLPVRVAITGANGFVGTHLIEALRARGDTPRAVVRSVERARRRLPADLVELVEWDPLAGAAPADVFEGCHAVVHLAGEPVAQRWTGAAKRRIHDSRATGTANLVAGIEALDRESRPGVLVCASGINYYGPRHPDDAVDESAPAGADFLAAVCIAWEQAARRAEDVGVRVVSLRTGIALDRSGGPLAEMLTPFKLGLGGPIAGGRQAFSWIALSDLIGLYLAAIDDATWSGSINATAPNPVSNREFTRALGRALHRPAIAPIPGFALRARYGDMADILVTGQRVIPTRAQELGYRFEHPTIETALAAALAPDR